MTYESVKHKNVHVIGDSTIGLPVPKSGNDRQRDGQDLARTRSCSLLNGQAGADDAAGEHLLLAG